MDNARVRVMFEPDESVSVLQVAERPQEYGAKQDVRKR